MKAVNQKSGYTRSEAKNVRSQECTYSYIVSQGMCKAGSFQLRIILSHASEHYKMIQKL